MEQAGRFFGQGDGLVRLARSDYIECCVDGGATEITFRVLEWIGITVAAKQAQKNGLQHIFGVAGIAGDAVGRPEHKTVVCPIGLLEFVRNGDCRFL